jgi:phage terminase large subunit GpA-like protein
MLDAVSDPSLHTIVIMSSAQIGKALALDTPLPTPGGWTTMGDVAVGDMLFDERGEPCRVVFATDTMLGRPCYRVTFSDGSVITADEEHRWAVHVYGKGDAILTTGDMLDFKQGKRNKYSVQVARPLNQPDASLPLDPYVLGLWLGDGHSASNRVFCGEEDLQHYLNELSAAGFSTHVQMNGCPEIVIDARSPDFCYYGHDKRETGRSKNNGCLECGRIHAKNNGRRKRGKEEQPMPPILPSMYRSLSSMGLISAKHIPLAYLRASIAQRTALLQGLMDSDGYCSKSGVCEFVTTSTHIADGVGELLASLGIKFSKKTKVPKTTYKGNYVSGKLAYRFSFTAYADTPVFRLSRKLARQQPKKKPRQVFSRYITDITPVKSVPVRCIQVDSPSHLFLAGDNMIPTHNTEVILNMLGYHMHQDPAPILCVLPTVDMGKAFAKDRVDSMVRVTPALHGLVIGATARKGGSTMLHKQFAGGHLTIAGSNSPTSLASRPVRFVLCDEVDRFPLSAGREGDPVHLARKRSTTFWNRKTVLTSTPTNRDTSRIFMEWENSDQRYYHVPCQHCGGFQRLTWESVKWPKNRPDQARIMCLHCGVLWTEANRHQAVLLGEWRATVPENAGTAGFHLSELYSPWSTPATMAKSFIKARKEGQDSLKTFINTSLGEPWEPPEGERVSWELLHDRREIYPAQVPRGVQVLVAGLDCQNDRVEGEVVGYGFGEESWGIDYFRIYGDPSKQHLWGLVLEQLQRVYLDEDGDQHEIRLVCIDSGGHYTDHVYDFSKGAGRNWVIPIKGSSERGRPIASFPRKPNRHGVFLTHIGTDTAKEVIYTRYGITTPGVGYCHIPKIDCYDENWCRQATTEEKLKKYKNGVPYYLWDAKERPNEATDCRVYALAALRILQQHMGVKLTETPRNFSRKVAKLEIRKPVKVKNPYL